MAYGAASGGGGQYLVSNQFLMWERYLPHTWCSLDDSTAPPAYHVDTDKGFVYSVADEAFVCQKKNHFQVTVHVGAAAATAAAETHYVHTAGGTLEVDHLLIKVFGVKVGQSGWLPHFHTHSNSTVFPSVRNHQLLFITINIHPSTVYALFFTIHTSSSTIHRLSIYPFVHIIIHP